MAPFESAKGRSKRKLPKVEEVPQTPQVEGTDQAQSSKGTGGEKSKKIKLSARGILATLSMRRISVANIDFIERGSRSGGTFADVAIAAFSRATRNGQEGRLAVKKLRFVIDGDMTEEKFFRLFANELRLLETLSHPNIVKIIGFAEDMKNRIAWLVFPWEDNGNLREFLRSGKWEIPERVSLIQDVARGLEYLHTREPPVCHGDLKSLNILVNSTHRAVITDFGSARILRGVQAFAPSSTSRRAASATDAAQTRNKRPDLKVSLCNTALTLTGPAWSFRWAPPEVLKGRPPDLASDVWALGWIAWEAITDCYPFEEVALEFHVTMKVIEGRLPSIYEHHQLSQIHRLCSSMQNCWEPDPMERPSATECLKSLSRIPNAIPVIKRGEQYAARSAALLLEIGEMHRLQSRRAEASEAFERGLAIARTTGDRVTLGGLLRGLARNHQAQSKHEEAEACYTEALSISKNMGHSLGLANALCGLADVQAARSKYIEAKSSYAESLTIYKRIGNEMGQANALLGLADVQVARPKYSESEPLYADSLAIYRNIGGDLGRANALLGLGHAQRALSKLIRAESSYSESLVIYEKIGADMGRANSLLGLADVQRARSNHDIAKSYYTKSLAIYQRIGGDLGRANALLGLGHAQQALAKYIEAESSYTGSLAIYQSKGDKLGQANALLGIGDIQRALSQYIEAESSYAKSLAIYKSIGGDLGRVNSSLGLAKVRLHQAQYAEAKALVDDSKSVSQRLNYAWGIQVSEALLEKVLKAEGSTVDS